ncbi:hypothetical protein [Paenibacillus sp. B01]|uniref:hypothetical protein n=1 Tax=Paenibacillus sp. B01 TaxID=2660554 RepID=UPI00129B8382|nr:hypothetical protein [Paenibacillus sp. B01]QGG57405.1 hypothetical protein GE073_18590 [Paenibacillus sp. B01]
MGKKIKLLAVTQNFDMEGNVSQFRVSYQVIESGSILLSNAMLVLPLNDELDLSDSLALSPNTFNGYTDGIRKIGESNVLSYYSILLNYLTTKIKIKEGVDEGLVPSGV